MHPGALCSLNRVLPSAVALLSLVACAGGVESGSTVTGNSPSAPTYALGGTVSGLSGSLTLQSGTGDSLTLRQDGRFTFGNRLAAGATYGVIVTSSPANQSCSVAAGSGSIANADVGDVAITCVVRSYEVTPSGDGRVAPTPASAQTVTHGQTVTFSVTVGTGFRLSGNVGGTCPAGTWSGNQYTTGMITAACTLAFGSTVTTYAVKPSGDGHESFTPDVATVVAHGAVQRYDVVPAAGYTVNASVGGTCTPGTWSGNQYTTGAIGGSCTLDFTASLNLYPVTPSTSAHVTANPATPQQVAHGAPRSFSLTPQPGYRLSSTVGGTCPAGSWVGNSYSTGAVTAACTVTFDAVPDVHLVTPSGDGHGTLSPSTPQSVTAGSSQSFTVTADAGYTTSQSVGGSCPAGNWSGNTYTTGAITSACSVSFSAVLTPTVTSVMPDAGPTTGGSPIDIFGSGFTAGASVDIGGNPATIVASNGSWIRVLAPAHGLGYTDVTVTVSGATSATSNASRYAYGTQRVFIADPLLGQVLACTPGGADLSTCVAASGGYLSMTAPTAISVMTNGLLQTLYMHDSVSDDLYACTLSTSSPTASGCSHAMPFVVGFQPLTVRFARFDGTQFAYVVGNLTVGGLSDVRKCQLDGANHLVNCAAAAAGSPPWLTDTFASLQDILFVAVNGTRYAYLSNSAHGDGAHAGIYRCRMLDDGGFDTASCAAMAHVPASSSPATMDLRYAGGVPQLYFGQTNSGGAVGNCALDPVTADFTSCAASGVTSTVSPSSLAIADPSGTPIAFVSDSSGGSFSACGFAGAGASYSVSAGSCVGLTTVGGQSLTTAGAVVVGYTPN